MIVIKNVQCESAAIWTSENKIVKIDQVNRHCKCVQMNKNEVLCNIKYEQLKFDARKPEF